MLIWFLSTFLILKIELVSIDRELFLIGTAHISKVSANLAEKVIRNERPDCVCLELDEKRFSSLKNAVKAAFGEADQKANVLFSPGFSSFDQFSSYEDRGKCFERAVLDLKKLGEQSNRPLMA